MSEATLLHRAQQLHAHATALGYILSEIHAAELRALGDPAKLAAVARQRIAWLRLTSEVAAELRALELDARRVRIVVRPSMRH